MSGVTVFFATLVVSLVSLVGILFFSLRKGISHGLLHLLIAFSAGTTLGTSFFDLLPETLRLMDTQLAVGFVAIGFSLFYFLERFIYCYHGHPGNLEAMGQQPKAPKTFVYLNLIGDGIHNLFDGVIVATTFLLDPSVGIITTLSIILHELPQEMGDYAVLVYGGLKERSALLLNLVVALTTVLGGMLTLQFIGAVMTARVYLLAVAGGGFIYLSASELIPELRDERNTVRSMMQFSVFALGLVVIWYLGIIVHEV
jgi:zinc and cadmium transporter